VGGGAGAKGKKGLYVCVCVVCECVVCVCFPAPAALQGMHPSDCKVLYFTNFDSQSQHCSSLCVLLCAAAAVQDIKREGTNMLLGLMWKPRLQLVRML
jgi:hypothetical protein